MKNKIILILLPILLTACQLTDEKEKLSPGHTRGAELQISLMDCLDYNVLEIGYEVEKETGISLTNALQLRQYGYDFKSLSCDSFIPYNAKIKKKKELKRRKAEEEKLVLEKEKTKWLEERVNLLNSEGEGEVKACSVGDYNSKTSVYYSNLRGKKIQLRTYDKHLVNAIHMELDKSQAYEFIKFIIEAQDKANVNSDIEMLELGEFRSKAERISIAARYGRLIGFWSHNVRVDVVITNISTDSLIPCIKRLIPHI